MASPLHPVSHRSLVRHSHLSSSSAKAEKNLSIPMRDLESPGNQVISVHPPGRIPYTDSRTNLGSCRLHGQWFCPSAALDNSGSAQIH